MANVLITEIIPVGFAVPSSAEQDGNENMTRTIDRILGIELSRMQHRITCDSVGLRTPHFWGEQCMRVSLMKQSGTSDRIGHFS